MKYVLLLVFFILIILGTWQVYRLQHKNYIELKLQKPSVELPLNVDRSYEYTKFHFKPQFISEKLMHLYAGVNGHYILLVAKTKNNKFLIVNLGTVNKKNDFKIEEIEEINGTLLFSNKKPLMISNYDERSDTWFGIDTNTMSKKLNIDLEPYIIWAERANIRGINNNDMFKVYNHHIEYVITWYLLALILAIYMIYLSFYQKN